MSKSREEILQMTKEVVHERVDQEIAKAVDNILDVNTEAKAKRKITLTIEMKPEDERRGVSMAITAQAILAPVAPVTTSVLIGSDEYGGIILRSDEQKSVAAKMVNITSRI